MPDGLQQRQQWLPFYCFVDGTNLCVGLLPRRLSIQQHPDPRLSGRMAGIGIAGEIFKELFRIVVWISDFPCRRVFTDIILLHERCGFVPIGVDDTNVDVE